MRALVISGGGSKGAFAGGVAEHLIRVQGRKYELYLGSSTESLLVSHLALNKIEKIKKVLRRSPKKVSLIIALLPLNQLMEFKPLGFITLMYLKTLSNEGKFLEKAIIKGS